MKQLRICIPTYNRNDQLAELLAGLSAIRTPPPSEVAVEIIVIDNNPGGEARAVIEQAQSNEPLFPIHYAHESKPGVAHVRNLALELASDANFLVFIDDDELPTKDWLVELWHGWEASKAAAVFGPVEAVYPSDTPAWMLRLRPHDCPVDDTLLRTKPGYTNNCLINLSVIRHHNLRFDPALSLTGGEDVLFFDTLLNLEEPLANAPKAWLTEKVPPERATLSWVKDRWRRVGATDAIAFARRKGDGRRYRVMFGQGLLRLLFGGTMTSLSWLVSGFRMNGLVARFLYTFQRGRGRLDYVFDRSLEEYSPTQTQDNEAKSSPDKDHDLSATRLGEL